jgi:hypothetical protein
MCIIAVQTLSHSMYLQKMDEVIGTKCFVITLFDCEFVSKE